MNNANTSGGEPARCTRMHHGNSNAAQVVLDVHLVRRATGLPAGALALWPPETKLALRCAEERLESLTGLAVLQAILEYGSMTGARVRI